MKRIIDNGKLPQVSKEELDKHWAKKFNITKHLFDKQLAFIEDPAMYKVAVCSRRSGKTVACAAHLIHTAINVPDSVCLYITLTATSGKRIIWKELRKILRQYKLDDKKDPNSAKINISELSITFPNESVIYIVGADDSAEIEKIRGLALKLAYIDECQSFKEHIADLIDDVLEPALLDYNGTLALIGTPSAIPTGYFHQCAVKSETWSKHHWTFFDNPFIPITAKMPHQQVLDRVLKRRGLTEADPSIQREYFGRWETDSDSLLIKWNKDKNPFVDLPRDRWNYILGIDVGFNDADALAVLAYSDSDPVTYLVDEVVTPKQGITELVLQVQELQKKYDINKMVMDMGGLGKKIGEELIRRYQIPVEAADKTRKMENVELLNDALRTNRFRAKATSRFVQDSYLVEIDRDKSRPDKIAVSSRYHSDIIDAVLYAFKLSPAYAYTLPEKEKPKWGTKEWAETEANNMFEAELEAALAEQENYKGFRD